MDKPTVNVENKVNLQRIGGGVKSVRVLAGYPGDVQHYSGYSAAELGKLLSEGGEDEGAIIPPRSHLDEGVLFAKDAVISRVKDHYASLLFHKRGKAYEVGEAMKVGIVDLLHSDYLRIIKPNAPYTVAKKGSDKPLIDTGELLSDIDIRVVEE